MGKYIMTPFPQGGIPIPKRRGVSPRFLVAIAPRNDKLRWSRTFNWVLLFVAFAVCAASEAWAIPRFTEVKNAYAKSDALLLDRHGKVIHELRVNEKGRRLDWAALKDISPALQQAVIQSEDRHFYGHRGVDWRAVGAAAFGKVFSGKKRGASTITMQLAAQLDRRLKPQEAKRSLRQKWSQMKAAQEVEHTWTKEEILEAYLNLIIFRGELQGVTTASRGLFGKAPSGLTDAESLILASLIRAPNASAATVAQRASWLARTMKRDAATAEIKLLASDRLTGLYAIKPSASLAPHVARQLLKEGKKEVVSTLDGALQGYAAEVLETHLRALRHQSVADGAVLAVDNQTGEILAYVANTGASASASYVDGIVAKRQAGSSIKPFLYEVVLEKKIITAATILDDNPLFIPTVGGIYAPQNYDNLFRGPVSVRESLASSINIPAVRTLMLIGPDVLVERLRKLGFENLEEGDYYGLSLALGSLDVSLRELVNAYRTLANEGQWSDLTITFNKKHRDKIHVMDKRAVYIISQILSDRESRGMTFGFENPLATKYWSAVKTGTSKDMRDNWCIGYSRLYTVGVWVGNFSGESMRNVTGVAGAAPVWLEVMNYLHRHRSSPKPQPPDGVVAKRIAFQPFQGKAVDEWFIAGTEPATGIISQAATAAKVKPKIVYPLNGTIIALDPDIPEENHLVIFEAGESGIAYSWQLNGAALPGAGHLLRWKPERGRHSLSIVGDDGTTLDSIAFEVRGQAALAADGSEIK
ncbi:MAG: penicillin-binding protein 1C [Syntrophaceae bacterium]|nr:penicillin-binding protein 1C [Syntrophaceae bacterium]